MPSDKRPPITLACEVCKRRNYVTTKNKRTMTEKLSKKKYDPIAKKHVEFREGKIK